jgi:hypothetical protein
MSDPKRKAELSKNYMLPDVDMPTVREVRTNPKAGDVLCFDGKKWQVAHHNGWHWPVPLAQPEESV